MVFPYFRARAFILALYTVKGQKVKHHLGTFLLSTSQEDYNTTLAGPCKTSGLPLSEPIPSHYICLGNILYLQDEGKKKPKPKTEGHRAPYTLHEIVA